jgi:putative PIN family toxin of toxin-antitoxin system
MGPRRRFVFDSSTLVSALLFDQSVPGKAFQVALDEGEVLISTATFAELNEVFAREKFDKYLTREDRERFLVLLLQNATFVEISEQIRACRDAKDDKFLELAVSGSASCIVASDKDLLVLKNFRGIPLLSPAEFLEWIVCDQG